VYIVTRGGAPRADRTATATDTAELTESFADFRGAEMAEAHAARFFLDACKRGEAEGCYQFALFVTVAHRGTTPDPALAKKYFGKACDAGHTQGCARSR
jgi:TPR repeat protein